MVLFRWIFSLAALIAFTTWVKGRGGLVFTPIFDLAGGDGDLLAALAMVFVLLIVVVGWAWSAAAHRKLSR
jgi:hypothetical protein